MIDRGEANPDKAEGLCKNAVGHVLFAVFQLKNKNLLAETGCTRLGSSCCGVSSLLSFKNNTRVTKALLEPLSARLRDQENSDLFF